MSTYAASAHVLWPPRAQCSRVLPKSKFYEYGQVSAKVREYFVRQVEQIVLDQVLAPSTTNLQPREAVPEIHVMRIQLKTRELKNEVLSCIDAVWRFPVIFELVHGGETRVVATYKRPASSDAEAWSCHGGYFGSAWIPGTVERNPLPLALDLSSLYQELLQRLLPLPMRAQESLEALIERIERVTAKQREVKKTQSQLSRTRQFNRKVEINARLRLLQAELQGLTT